jgi:hypothetical protein
LYELSFNSLDSNQDKHDECGDGDERARQHARMRTRVLRRRRRCRAAGRVAACVDGRWIGVEAQRRTGCVCARARDQYTTHCKSITYSQNSCMVSSLITSRPTSNVTCNTHARTHTSTKTSPHTHAQAYQNCRDASHPGRQRRAFRKDRGYIEQLRTQYTQSHTNPSIQNTHKHLNDDVCSLYERAVGVLYARRVDVFELGRADGETIPVRRAGRCRLVVDGGTRDERKQGDLAVGL